MWQMEARQHKQNKNVASDVNLSCNCCFLLALREYYCERNTSDNKSTSGSLLHTHTKGNRQLKTHVHSYLPCFSDKARCCPYRKFTSFVLVRPVLQSPKHQQLKRWQKYGSGPPKKVVVKKVGVTLGGKVVVKVQNLLFSSYFFPYFNFDFLTSTPPLAPTFLGGSKPYSCRFEFSLRLARAVPLHSFASKALDQLHLLANACHPRSVAGSALDHSYTITEYICCRLFFSTGVMIV